MLIIRNADVSDIELIRELNGKVWPQTYRPIIGEAQVNYMLDRFYSPEALNQQMTELNHAFILCYDDDLPVAFASFGLLEPGIYKLHKLYIALDRQGKGIGRMLIDHISVQLKSGGCQKLRLNVNIYNKSAIAFYAKTGFKKIKDEDIPIGDGFFMNDHVYELELV